ncbi:MAG: YwqG family protein [Neisseria sp.]|nr:YwqG family protein [Neisseria sp.]
MTDIIPEFAPYADEIRATARPSVRFTLKAGSAELWDSKVGGNPYLPQGMEYPRNAEGQPMALLAQINFAQMPALPDYPAEGILQFFICDDGLMGMDFDNMVQHDGSGFRVIYHPQVQTEGLQHDFPDLENEDGGLPFEFGKEYRMVFQNAEQQYMSLEDYRFESSMPKLNRFLEDKAEEEDYDWTLHEKYGDAFFCETHRIGGYPFFTQEDPRAYANSVMPQDYELLFQLASDCGKDQEVEVMWGDAGVGGFFIRPEDLKKRDFSKVAYNWDCC